MMSENPSASLREIARAVGLSPATVLDVRERTDNGEDPVPARYRDTGSGGSGTGNDSRQPGRRPSSRSAGRSEQAAQAKVVNPRELLANLANDPALKFSESGRHVVGWLRHYSPDDESSRFVAASIPDRWVSKTAELARSCAATWIRLAEQLEQRSFDDQDAG